MNKKIKSFILIIFILGWMLVVLTGCNNNEVNDNSENIKAYICCEGTSYELKYNPVIVNDVSELNEILRNISPNSDEIKKAMNELNKYGDEFFESKKLCIEVLGANVGTDFEIVNVQKYNDSVKVQYKYVSNIKDGDYVIALMHYNLAIVEIDKNISWVTFECIK